jgi:putative membrane protein
MTPSRPARPRAFRLDDPQIVFPDRQAQAPEPAAAEPRPAARAAPPEPPGKIVIEAQPDPYAREASLTLRAEQAEPAVELAQRQGMLPRRRWTWSGLFWTALGGCISLAVGLWIDEFVESLFSRSPALGWIGLALAVLLATASLALLAREMASVWRQTRIARLHGAIAAARLADDRDAARRHVAVLAQLYAHRPSTARARAELASLSREIVDGRDLIDIAERSLMQPLDERVRREIAAAAKRVSLVTAMSPRAVFDVLFVAAQAVYLMRKTAEIYGGRPGLLGLFKLARSVMTHLAITGGMAVGDSILQQFLGHGIASRLSARLGEGVLNGLLTARIGLSAMAVCRPMPFSIEKQPNVKDVAPFLFTSKKD